MASKPPSHPVDLEQLERLLWILTALFFTGAAITLVGELVGWWQDAGEIALTILTVGGVFVGVAALGTGATRTQAHGLETQLGTIQGTLGGMDRTLGGMDHKLGGMDHKLEKLDGIEAALVQEDGMLDRLDVVQVHLDAQTGVMDRQLSILAEIRDRL